MKNIGWSVAALLLSASIGFAQGEALAEAQKTLKEKYPAANSVKWEKETDGGWEAEFTINGNETSVEFDSKGTWKQTETEIETSDLPEAVLDAIKTKYAEYSVEEAEMVETADGEVVYEVDFKKGKTEMELLFASDGSVIKTMNEDEDEEEVDED